MKSAVYITEQSSYIGLINNENQRRMTMTNLNDMNKKDLLGIAKGINLLGRHEMTKVELIEGITKISTIDNDVGQVTVEDVMNAKRRHPSNNERGDDGKVVRVGKNLSGNTPFRKKFYYLDPSLADEKKWSDEYRKSVEAAPNQVSLILKFMRVNNITDVDSSMLGGQIVEHAKTSGGLSSKIPSANLYAYYAKLLSALGVINVTSQMQD